MTTSTSRKIEADRDLPNINDVPFSMFVLITNTMKMGFIDIFFRTRVLEIKTKTPITSFSKFSKSNQV